MGDEAEVDSTAPEPDVLLDVPTLNVEELELEVENLQAHVSVRAELADFVNVNIGVDAHLDKVKLKIKGVEAQLQLKVRLERILGTIESALAAIEQNPGLLDGSSRHENRGPLEEGSTEAPKQPEDAPQPETRAGAGGEVEATDAARRKAEDLGVDLSQVEGTGSGGRVLVRDVQKVAR
ncbi:MAG TPA: E3 binding domain-containing protein [Rubrobacteraceae bacterium]|nr:E3 binding domain-containing protein [Rubrobacteraceae bacterium]